MYLKKEFIFEDKETSKLNNKGSAVIIHIFPALRRWKRAELWAQGQSGLHIDALSQKTKMDQSSTIRKQTTWPKTRKWWLIGRGKHVYQEIGEIQNKTTVWCWCTTNRFRYSFILCVTTCMCVCVCVSGLSHRLTYTNISLVMSRQTGFCIFPVGMQNSGVTLYTRQVLDKTSLLGFHPREMKAIFTQNLHLKVYNNFSPHFFQSLNYIKCSPIWMVNHEVHLYQGGSDTQYAERQETESGTQYFTKVHRALCKGQIT